MDARTQRKILIVDDTPDIITFLSVRLRAEGFDVYSAFSGIEGIEKAKEIQPDLIILDVVMPQLNGFQVCRKLKSFPEFTNTPIVFLTAKNQPSDRFWGMEVGASAYLTKPVDLRELSKTVKKLLGLL